MSLDSTNVNEHPLWCLTLRSVGRSQCVSPVFCKTEAGREVGLGPSRLLRLQSHHSRLTPNFPTQESFAEWNLGLKRSDTPVTSSHTAMWFLGSRTQAVLLGPLSVPAPLHIADSFCSLTLSPSCPLHLVGSTGLGALSWPAPLRGLLEVF